MLADREMHSFHKDGFLKNAGVASVLFMCLLTRLAPGQVTWTSHSLNADEVYNLNGIAFYNNLYVVVGYSNLQNFAALLTSSNGSTWTGCRRDGTLPPSLPALPAGCPLTDRY
jgi:hypothetical protein